MFVSLPVFLNQCGQQWKDYLISLHAFSTLWMDTVTEGTRMFIQEKASCLCDHPGVLSAALMNRLCNFSRCRLNLWWKVNSKIWHISKALSWFWDRQRRLDPQTETDEGRCPLKRPLQWYRGPGSFMCSIWRSVNVWLRG